MIPGNDRTAGPSGDRGKAISLATGGFSSASVWANGSAGSTSWPVIGTLPFLPTHAVDAKFCIFNLLLLPSWTSRVRVPSPAP